MTNTTTNFCFITIPEFDNGVICVTDAHFIDVKNAADELGVTVNKVTEFERLVGGRANAWYDHNTMGDFDSAAEYAAAANEGTGSDFYLGAISIAQLIDVADYITAPFYDRRGVSGIR